jgi:2-polyprenyl-3-methyl-5-hydroxy-6-metoxy-1,4-benzoquinol methylase
MIFLNKINYNLKDIHESYWKMLVSNIGDDYSVDSLGNQDLLLNDLNIYRKTGNLLEIGCGDGRFLKLARDRGWQVAGVELSAQAVNMARQKYGLNVLSGPLEEVAQGLKNLSFDIIIMWGVIEHLQNPLQALKIAKSLLRKGGVLIIYTPNANSIFHRLARGIYFSTKGLIKFPMERVIIAMHVMYFAPHTLRYAMSKCGLLIKKIEMKDIDLDFIFKAHSNLWWSNRVSLFFAKFLQRLSHLNTMHSHMLVFAEPV